MSRRFSLGKRLALALGSLAAAGALGELAFRWLGPAPYSSGSFRLANGDKVPNTEIAHFLRRGGMLDRDLRPPRGRLQSNLKVRQGYDRPRWRYFDADGCIEIAHDSLGFRDHELPLQKPAGEFRIIALGDSFTYGSGVQLDDSWPQVLERLLQQRRIAPVQVINAGFACGSFTPAGYDVWMQSDGLQFAPDLVIVGLCLNDMGDGNEVPMLSYALPRGMLQVGDASPPPPTCCGSRILGAIVQHWQVQRARREQHDFAAVVREHPGTWNATQAALINLKRILDGAKVPLVVAVLPMLSQLELDPYPYAGLHAMAGEFCRANGIHCVDLFAPFRGKDEWDLWVHPTDQHPNDVGHRLIADGIFAFLQQTKLDGTSR